jgi:hypothetical protein
MDMDEELFFEVLEDPEMTHIGQRLIMQGGELLDDTDLSPEERKKVEKVFSECWEDLREVKGLKDAFLKMSENYPNGRNVSIKKGYSPKELFAAFVVHSLKVLDHLIKMLGPLTYGKISHKSYLKHRDDILKALSHPERDSKKETSYQALVQVIQEGESYWIESLTELHNKVQTNGHLEKTSLFKNDSSSSKGPWILEDGASADEKVHHIWKNLIDFCEDFVAHAIQIRFLEIVEGLEVIPHQMQDPVYPRRFKVLLRKASHESDGTEA